jgi:YrbI family 3-deoxy-D-manno-octulosonate 8-phosphate phosphatase
MDAQHRLKIFRGLMLDADGVLFTGTETRFLLPGGNLAVGKVRSLSDGQGLSFLRALGIEIVFASGEGQPLQSIVEKLNALPSVVSGLWPPIECITNELNAGGKVASLEAWLHKRGFAWNDCAYIGDDRSDLEAMRLAGLAIAPSNAQRLIKKIAHMTLSRNGGDGAVREFAEMVLDARGIDEGTLPAA